MSLRTPVLFINLKTYKEGTGARALSLAMKAQETAEKKGLSIVIVAQASDIRMLCGNITLPVFGQHVDSIGFGPNTGSILPEAIKEAGALGTVLNHTEKKLPPKELEKSLARAKEAGLIVMVCAETAEKAKEIASFSVKPDFIAVEPPELIGGEISISTAKPELIGDTVRAVHSIASIPVITGAGIKNSADVKKSLELGTQGVFVASGIVKAHNPGKAIEDLLEGFG